MISIRYSQIPDYLRKGAFYRGLSDHEDDEQIQIPKHCYSPDEIVKDTPTLVKALQIAAFWLLDCIPNGIIKFCCENDPYRWIGAISKKHDREAPGHYLRAHNDNVDLAFVSTLRALFGEKSKSYEYSFFFEQAVKMGVDEVVEYLIEHPDVEKTVASANAAARCGRLDTLKRLHHAGFPWDSEACAVATAHGHFNCLQYLHENGCPWDYQVYKNASHVDFVRYAFENGLQWDSNVSVNFAHCGRVDCLQYAVDHGCSLHKMAATVAARNGHFKTLKFLREHGCEWDSQVYLEAADRSNLNIVQYAFENNLEWHPDTCVRLAKKGNHEILQYAVDRGCQPTAEAATLCATHGYADCLRAMLQVGCPVDETITLQAVKKGKVELLRCAFENGCPYVNNIVDEAAASEKNAVASLRFLVDDQGLYMNQDGSLFVAAFARGDFECVRYLIDVGYDCNVWGEERLKQWQTYLTEHAKYTHYYKQLMDKLDSGLLNCIEYAVTHSWDIQNNGALLVKHIQAYPGKYPVSYAHLRSEEFYYV